MKNPILDELHKTRERLLAEAGGTMEGLVARLQQDERLSGREIVHPKRRTAAAVGQARREFAAGQCQPMTAAEIVREAQS